MLKVIFWIVGVIMALIVLIIFVVGVGVFVESRSDRRREARALQSFKLVLGISNDGKLFVAINHEVLLENELALISLKNAGSRWGYKRAAINAAIAELRKQNSRTVRVRYLEVTKQT